MSGFVHVAQNRGYLLEGLQHDILYLMSFFCSGILGKVWDLINIQLWLMPYNYKLYKRIKRGKSYKYGFQNWPYIIQLNFGKKLTWLLNINYKKAIYRVSLALTQLSICRCSQCQVIGIWMHALKLRSARTH